MRLLNTETLELSNPFVPSLIPEYAILSHRWNADEEVTFSDISKAPICNPDSATRNKAGFAKVLGACTLARKDGYKWIWIDSCCIDKSSSAELQESINTMWRYYAHSHICYVYLADVANVEAGWGPVFERSEWFVRGWTLQELIAPVYVEFFAANWQAIGTKFERYQQISRITSIDADVLVSVNAIHARSAAEKLSWAAHRNVTREEDQAYSLLGLFDVNIPLLYGEGQEKAFVRLQEAIYNATSDHSIFLFRYTAHNVAQPLLASSPACFCDKLECKACILRTGQGAPMDFRYANIVASYSWKTQAHEQIMTTVTMSSHESSTVLPLLPYEDVSNYLKFFDPEFPQVQPTHVAVLNYTLRAHPQGAFCLLLRRWPNVDGTTRLQVFPAILPNMHDLSLRLEKTKVRICSGPRRLEMDNGVNIFFSVDSSIFQVETWVANKASISHSILSAPEGQSPAFKVRAMNFGRQKLSVKVSCRSSGSQDPKLFLTLELVRVHGVCSIKEIIKRKSSNARGEHETLFHSTVLADRCSIKLQGEKTLVVKLRRLPSSALASQQRLVVDKRYQISIEYR